MNKEQSNLRLFDKALGSLIGFAIGDTMGATTEFMTSEEIKNAYGEVHDIIGGGWLNLEPGEVTDDTEMMVAVAQAYINAINHPEDFEKTFLKGCCDNFSLWYMSKPKDIGNACRQAIATCMGKPAEDWVKYSEEVNQAYPSLGNGSLMRCLFPALVGDEVSAVSQGTLTHNNTGVSGCIISYTRRLQKYLYSTSTKAPGTLTPAAPIGKADTTLRNAIYWSCAPSFSHAIIGAVNDGGDADTIAALVGGLAGARFGYSKIPAKWVQQLKEETYTLLRQLAEIAIEIIPLKSGEN